MGEQHMAILLQGGPCHGKVFSVSPCQQFRVQRANPIKPFVSSDDITSVRVVEAVYSASNPLKFSASGEALFYFGKPTNG